jgi:hypothetical protein
MSAPPPPWQADEASWRTLRALGPWLGELLAHGGPADALGRALLGAVCQLAKRDRPPADWSEAGAIEGIIPEAEPPGSAEPNRPDQPPPSLAGWIAQVNAARDQILRLCPEGEACSALKHGLDTAIAATVHRVERLWQQRLAQAIADRVEWPVEEPTAPTEDLRLDDEEAAWLRSGVSRSLSQAQQPPRDALDEAAHWIDRRLLNSRMPEAWRSQGGLQIDAESPFLSLAEVLEGFGVLDEPRRLISQWSRPLNLEAWARLRRLMLVERAQLGQSLARFTTPEQTGAILEELSTIEEPITAAIELVQRSPTRVEQQPIDPLAVAEAWRSGLLDLQPQDADEQIIRATQAWTDVLEFVFSLQPEAGRVGLIPAEPTPPSKP